MHEVDYFDQKGLPSSFVTLTYSPENLPPNGELVKSDFQKFFKRLRRKWPEKGLRYYMCGEYGSENLRPHYHSIVFGTDFRPWEPLNLSPWNKEPYYTSPSLSERWGLGHVQVAPVTFESAAYVARYIMKKAYGQASPQVARTDLKTGELQELEPEYTKMSRFPPIGEKWLQKYHADVYPHDFCVLSDGRKVKPPKAYDRFMQQKFPALMDEIKQQRRESAQERAKDSTPERLAVREEVQRLRANKLVRSL